MDQAKINSIEQKLEQDFEEGGYKLKNIHIRNGRNLHSDQYYFAKRYFQNTENCSQLADILCDKLQELDFPESTTLIGLRNYTGLLLHETISRLNKFNYILIEEKNDNYFWQHPHDLKENLVIILPITCTCSSYIKLRKFITDFLYKNNSIYPKTTVNENFINVFLILEETLKKPEYRNININNFKKSEEEFLYNIYSAFNWTEIKDDKIYFSNETATNNFIANSLIRLYSKLYLPEHCVLCFPNSDKSINEKPITPTQENYETPNLIFGFPNFNNISNTRDFFDSFGNNIKNHRTHLYGHIKVNENSFTHYIKGNAFYENNKSTILSFFDGKLLSFLGSEENGIIFITPDNKHNSSFLIDLTFTANSLKNRSVTLLSYQPSNEFVDNFISLHGKMIQETNVKVIYFEEVMSSAKTFKLISNYIKHSRKTAFQKINRHGFDLVLTLVDRTSLFTKDEIIRKLSSENTIYDSDNIFFAYYKLNVPIVSSSLIGNPLNYRLTNLNKIIETCQLDSLKIKIGKEITTNRPIDISEINLTYEQEDNILYFPFKNIEQDYDSNILELYMPIFFKKNIDLIKLYLVHEINCILSEDKYQNASFWDNYSEKPQNLITDLIQNIDERIRPSLENYLFNSENKNIKFRNKEIEIQIIHDLIIKLLSRHPFTYYRNIYDSIFCFIIQELDKLHSQIEISGIKSFSVFWKLKFLIRRSIELNSNFIISSRFLNCLKRQFNQKNVDAIPELYKNNRLRLEESMRSKSFSSDYYQYACNNIDYKLKQVNSYFSFLLYCYKELIFKNPSRSLKLEELINSYQFSLDKNPHFDCNRIEDLITSQFNHFLDMVSIENIFFLKELKELHKLNLSKKNFEEINNYKKHYLGKSKKNDPIIINARNFVKKSKIKLNRNGYIIETCIGNMLKSIKLLESKTQNLNNENNSLNTEIKEILNSILDIIQPGVGSGALKYGFIVEFKKRNINTKAPENLYTIFSDEKMDNYKNLKISRKGLIYNMMYGLFENEDSSNELTFISSAKSSSGKMTSFKEKYYHQPIQSGLNLDAIFSELYQNDIYNPNNDEGLHMLEESNMTIVCRFSKLILPKISTEDSSLHAQALLIISNSEESNIENYLNFANSEKVRLLLLVRDELLVYLQKQFDNEAFIEILENRNTSIYQSSLRHGLAGYIDSLGYLLQDIELNSAKEEYFELFHIITNAMKGQLEALETGNAQKIINNYSRENIINIIKMLFNSTSLGYYSIDFNEIDLSEFKFKDVNLHRLIFEVIMPEIIINMKKYCPKSGDRRLSISYNSALKIMYFKNRIIPSHPMVKTSNKRGGLNMCSEILQNIGLGRIEKITNGDIFIIELHL